MKSISLKVWGDFACFTRPEMKVERVSYDVMTPSAARGILEAILWKPAIAWRIHSIAVLKPVRWIQFRRNELGSKIPPTNVTSVMKKGAGQLGTFIEDDRQQRAGLFLRDVAYVIQAEFEMTNKAGSSDNPAKFAEMFKRRVENGQCHVQPVFGCREFSAYFSLPNEDDIPINETKDLGWMLYDMDFSDANNIQPKFFRAQMNKGLVEVPSL
ncbi:MAG: type I-C CRISPR-associated protein Cas5 [Spirochaetes bacterium]|nr:type I-C CRISPR-associated protein Cas5 [Spirochaetota bacterium]